MTIAARIRQLAAEGRSREEIAGSPVSRAGERKEELCLTQGSGKMGEVGDYWREHKEHKRIVKTWGSVGAYQKHRRETEQAQRRAGVMAQEQGSGIYDEDDRGRHVDKPFICECGKAFRNAAAQRQHAKSLGHAPIERDNSDPYEGRGDDWFF